jgi:hypothetical protein
VSNVVSIEDHDLTYISALQESMLSPRLVNFGYRQIEARCWKKTEVDGGYFDNPRDRCNLPISNVKFADSDGEDFRLWYPILVETPAKIIASAHQKVSPFIPQAVSKALSNHPLETSWESVKPIISGNPWYKAWGLNTEKQKVKGATRTLMRSFVLNAPQMVAIESWQDIVECYTQRFMHRPEVNSFSLTSK